VGWTEEEEEEEEKFVFFSLVEEEEVKRIIYGAGPGRKVKNGRAFKKNISKIIILRLGSLFSLAGSYCLNSINTLHHFFFFSLRTRKKEKSENPL
jgi:hypothetical protein